ncbi:MAG TPA: hypothetical protein VMB21_20195 [Candidatus Limnocylindria bacterium]|jgi:hypothetical protein|nr:hypothetical protein [Candidatus Limnocylindria bacterium]
MNILKARIPVLISTGALASLLGAVSLHAEDTRPVPATNAPVAAQAQMVTPPKATVNKQAEENAQSRLQPVTPGKVIAKHGALGALFVKSSKVKPLQLINPLAPAEYGGNGQPPAVWNSNPKLAPGQAPLPRGFEDDRTQEHTAVLFSWGSR